MTYSQAIQERIANNPHAVRMFTMHHVVDMSNIRYPNEFTKPGTCEATIFVHNGVVKVGHISNLSFDLIYNVRSWLDLEAAIKEEAESVYL